MVRIEGVDLREGRMGDLQDDSYVHIMFSLHPGNSCPVCPKIITQVQAEHRGRS